jgi:hypothetical protein
MIKKATRTLARCESLLGRQSITNDFERVALRGLPKPYSGTMVARDGVERFSALCNQQVADYTMDTKDTKDSKDVGCVRFVCGFFSPKWVVLCQRLSLLRLRSASRLRLLLSKPTLEFASECDASKSMRLFVRVPRPFAFVERFLH